MIMRNNYLNLIKDYNFTTIQMMSKNRYLERFAADYFNNIVINPGA